MRDVFGSGELDVEGFLRNTQTVAHEELLLQLDRAANDVQTELHTLITRDYAQLRELLLDVCRDDPAEIHALRLQVEADKTLAEEQYNQLHAFYDEAVQKHSRLQYVRRKKDVAMRVAKAQDYIHRFDLLLGSGAIITPLDLEPMVDNYLWILNFTTESRAYLEADYDLYPEMSRFSERLQELLETQLTRALAANTDGDVPLLAQLLHRQNKLNVLEAAVRETCITGVLNAKIHDMLQLQGEHLVDFERLLDEALANADRLKTRWTELVNQLYGSVAYKFWVRAVLGPTLMWMLNHVSSVFIPVNLDQFKKNFDAALAFVLKMEGDFLRFDDELAYFRSHAAWGAFMKKWALHQYFRIRVKQLISPVENILSYPLDTRPEPRMLEQTMVTLNALAQLWSDGVIVKPLIPKFGKVTLQVMRRFIEYCSSNPEICNDPKTFVLDAMQKHYNLQQFAVMTRESVFARMSVHMNSIEGFETLADNLQMRIEREVAEKLQDMTTRLIRNTCAVYESQLSARPSLQTLETVSLQALIILQQSHKHFDISLPDDAFSPIEPLLQPILLKINQAVFKIIEEAHGQPPSFATLRTHMDQLELEAATLGYASLATEEFWLEIKTATQ